MEPLFTDSVKLSEDTFRQILIETMEISKDQKKKTIRWQVIYACACLFMLLEAWFSFTRQLSVAFIILGCVSVLLAIFFGTRALFYRKIVLKNALRKSLRLQQESGALNRVDEYKFYEDNFWVTSLRYKMGKRINWDTVYKVFESRSFYFVYSKDRAVNNSFFFYKPNIKGGTEEEFKQYIQNAAKCPIEQQVS